ncbi:MAG: hypothetical protein EZS28_003149 [Streblomastix strix]|uniref:Uncharacterized protein n=1 Tax=Streblomastix strix TaxID=222440 RepID=A0A5J4X3U2_9EUKA|nr:MAG: hypothetical protein EZS28_003149 [Streblomastix strix]
MSKDQIAGGCAPTNGGGDVNGNITIGAYIATSGNIISTSFIKTIGTNQQVLLVNGTTKQLSEFDAVGSSEFPELYAYIKERYPKPIGELAQPVPIGDQTLQQQVKNIDDIIYGQAIAPMKITLTASYATTDLFPYSYLFKTYPLEARPKSGDQVIALVGTESPKTYYESSKKINYEVNRNGKIDFMDTCNVNGKGTFEAQSYVYETVKKQSDSIEAGVQRLNRTNYLKSEIKLRDELAIYKANRAAYFIKDGPFIVYSFGTKFDMYDKTQAVQLAVSGQLNTLDCEFQGTYILDNYMNSTNTNESVSEEPESHIDEVIIKHEKILGLDGRTQEVGRISESILPSDGKKPQESISTDSADVYKQCASGMYYL